VLAGTLNFVPHASISTKAGLIGKQGGKGGLGGDGGLIIVRVTIVFRLASKTVYFTVHGIAP
jgi:hypothetical protein